MSILGAGVVASRSLYISGKQTAYIDQHCIRCGYIAFREPNFLRRTNKENALKFRPTNSRNTKGSSLDVIKTTTSQLPLVQPENVYSYLGSQRKTHTCLTSQIDPVSPHIPLRVEGSTIYGRSTCDRKDPSRRSVHWRNFAQRASTFDVDCSRSNQSSMCHATDMEGIKRLLVETASKHPSIRVEFKV
ncbi:hypothetical protein ARAM_000544 [Aspergillus rambellii]|uniref:Uncharacterized protein n=1 Tax=Aspergillus rambellii TaxID=308745 RepID=A0A0F8WPM4_9EURO|nr:hypothetical protein ARAM_000544 [Aspergillus rambellii]